MGNEEPSAINTPLAQDDSEDDVYNLYCVDGTRKTPPITLTMRINNTDTIMEVDTGASLTIMSVDTFDRVAKKGGKLQIQQFRGKFRTYTGGFIQPIRVVETLVEYGNQKAMLPW